MAKITFLGAAGTVTGSKYLVEAEGKRLLVDCGLFQGTRELTQRNWETLPIDPATIDWVLLTHAHIDHTGYLPRLVRSGFPGPDLRERRDARALRLAASRFRAPAGRRRAVRRQERLREPQASAAALYRGGSATARWSSSRIFRAPTPFTISPQFSVRGHDAGHILGSSWLELTITENGKQMLVVFSGDVGRYGQPILKDPEPPTRADFLLCESTYGDRDHPAGSVADELADVINRTAKRGGAVVIPAFAVGRTQTLMYYLRELEWQQRIPHLPIYVDSPMAINVTGLYAKPPRGPRPGFHTRSNSKGIAIR